MTRKRISRARKRDLEQPDEFLSVTASAIQKINRYRIPLTIGAVVVLASLATFSLVRYFAIKAENQVSQRLNANLQAYRDAGGDSTPRQALEQVKPQFESLLAESGRREGGKLARLVYADLNYRAGNFDVAITNYKLVLEVLEPHQFSRGSALSGLGYAYIAAGQNDAAVKCFEAIIDGDYAPLKADALYQLGRLYGAQGDAEKQQATYQRLLEEAPSFVYADLIKHQLDS